MAGNYKVFQADIKFNIKPELSTILASFDSLSKGASIATKTITNDMTKAGNSVGILSTRVDDATVSLTHFYSTLNSGAAIIRQQRAELEQLFALQSSISVGPRGGVSSITSANVPAIKQSLALRSSMSGSSDIGQLLSDEAVALGIRNVDAFINQLARLDKENSDAWLRVKTAGIEEMSRLMDELVGHSIVPDMVDKIIAQLNRIPANAKGPIAETIAEFEKLRSNVDVRVGGTTPKGGAASQVKQQLESIQADLSNYEKVIQHFTSKLGPDFTDKYSEAWEK